MSAGLTWILGVIFFLNLPTLVHAGRSCESYLQFYGVRALESTESRQAHLLRRTLLEARDSFLEHSSDAAWFSQSLGREWQHASPEIGVNGHVISFGSGPDIFRPIFDWPLAKHFHLVDLFTGWGADPLEPLTQILVRLQALGPETNVQIIDRGFLNEFTTGQLQNGEFFREVVRILPEARTPAKIRVQWKDPALGTQTRFIWLHPMDYNNQGEAQELINSIPTGDQLTGILATGALMPESKILKKYIFPRLLPGAIVVEENYRREQMHVIWNGFSRVGRWKRRWRKDFEAIVDKSEPGFFYEWPMNGGVFPQSFMEVYILRRRGR